VRHRYRIIPLLKTKSFNNRLTLSYFISRITEAVLLGIGSFSFALFESKAIFAHTTLFNIAMLILGLYSTWSFFSLPRCHIGPNWLLYIGSIGYIALKVYYIFSILTSGQIKPMWLFAPGAIYEIAFPIWLIIKRYKNADE